LISLSVTVHIDSDCHPTKDSMLSARISCVREDSSKFFINSLVLNQMFQRTPISCQNSSYSSAFTVMIISDGLLELPAGIIKSLVARNINQSDVINCVSLTKLYSCSFLLKIFICP
jgi:hypothetical protein